jgi:undecaprenyl-diphosphatase
LFEARKIGSSSVALAPTLVSTVIAFIVGYLVIAWLIRYLMTKSYLPFVIYRIVLGLVVLLLLALGVLHSGA